MSLLTRRRILAFVSLIFVACSPRTASHATVAVIPVANSPTGFRSDDPPTAAFFNAQVVDDKLFFEVPASALNSDFLIYQENARNQQVLRWVRRGGKLLLVKPDVTYVAGASVSQQAVSRRGKLPPIIAVLPIESERPNGAAVVDVTRLFTTETQGFLGASSRTDEMRSFVERVSVYPNNLEIEAVHTRAAPPAHDGEYPTTRVHWSVVRLPTQLMRPRLFDPRFGFWMESTFADGADYFAATRGSITRWRLEKKNPSQAVSEPISPIVFYVDPETPEQWRSWIKKGIEAWQPAFEAAGFRNAIIAKDPPLDDPLWSVDDVRNSVVRWYKREQRDNRPAGGNAQTVVDRRTGEILKANAYVPEKDVLLRDWYFTMVAPLNPQAQKLPLPDSLMGRLLQFVVSHELGHALGLQDGSYGGLAYPVDSLRSASWLRRMRHTPSVMNYSRFNYVAQPEDSIPPDLLVQQVGPADAYSIHWGYAPIPSAESPDAERPILDAWAQVQDTVPWYRFVHQTAAEELYEGSDASNDADPIRSAELGVKNLRRVMDILPFATLSQGSDNALLKHLYFEILSLWRKEIRRVTVMIGGFTVQYKSGSQPGPVHTPLPPSRQRAAMSFLDTMAFRLPEWMIRPDITRRFEFYGIDSRIVAMQAAVLGEVLDTERLHRLSEVEALERRADTAYPVAELLVTLRASIWSELGRTSVAVAPHRQSLQHAHLTLMQQYLTTPPAFGFELTEQARHQSTQPSTTERVLLRLEIQALHDKIARAIPRSADRGTRGHLELMRQTIERTLESRGPS
jgi:hypothetical protein